jgi:protein O-mannosyl-transferase
MKKRNKTPATRDPHHQALKASPALNSNDILRENHCPPDSKFRVPTHYIVLFVCCFLLFAVELVFGQTVKYNFINFDDDNYIFNNPQVKHGLTVKGIAWAFTTSHVSNWHPLTWLSHMLDCQFYGLYAGGHHLTNVLLHAAVSILLFLVLWRMTGNLGPSAFAATVFAIHPLRVESVAWVSERKDILSGLFFLLTIGAYVGYVRRPFSPLRYLAVIVLFALGLMCKPMIVTLPFVLLLLDYWPLGRIMPLAAENADVQTTFQLGRISVFTRLIIEKIPLLLLSSVSCVITFLVQSKAFAPLVILPLPSRIANALVSYVAYLGQFFYPVGLAILYPHPADVLPADGLQIWKVTVAILVLAGISMGALVCWQRNPSLLVGWLWYLGMLVPVIGLVQVGVQSMADRYTYLPEIGLCIALAWGTMYVTRLWPYRRWVCGVASVLVVAALMGCAWRQTTFWNDSETLWNHTLACTSRNYVAHNNLAGELLENDQTEEAMDHFELALAIKPDYIEALYNMGNALNLMGRQQEAIEHFQHVLRLKPKSPHVYIKLGDISSDKGQVREAIDYFKKALALDPNLPEVYNNLGNLLLDQGQTQEAVESYKQALQLNPDYINAYYNLGNAFKATGQYQQAIEPYKQALQLKPDYIEARNNLGMTLLQTGQPREAIDQFKQVLQIQPDNLSACNNLASAYASNRQSSEAVATAQKALELAKSQGKTAQAKQIEDWLNSYRANLPDHPISSP